MVVALDKQYKLLYNNINIKMAVGMVKDASYHILRT